MKDKRSFVVHEIEPKDFVHKDAIRAVECWFVIHTDNGGYTENGFTFHKWEDGSISISLIDRDDCISIHNKEVLDVLRDLLK